MSGTEDERMEVEDQQPPTAADLDTLKAEARDIVDKAAAKAQTEVCSVTYVTGGQVGTSNC